MLVVLKWWVFLGRVIIEFGGKCEFKEVEPFLTDVANKLPFKAMAVSQEMLDKQKEQDTVNCLPCRLFKVKCIIQCLL